MFDKNCNSGMHTAVLYPPFDRNRAMHRNKQHSVIHPTVMQELFIAPNSNVLKAKNHCRTAMNCRAAFMGLFYIVSELDLWGGVTHLRL